MNENFINEAAKLYYKEHVEGEPLNYETPIECFIAGGEFIVRAMKIHQNNCNISDYSSYNHKNISMDDASKINKILTNVEKIMKITGFYVIAPGDESVGIPPATWEIKNDFYFDTLEDLENFKIELQSLFEYYCGEVTSIITFEEHQAECDNEVKEYYLQYPIRYLIKDGNNFKQANSTASYSNNIGDGIHFELPSWMSEDGYNGFDTVIIKSDKPEFRNILLEEAGRLEREIHDEKSRLRLAKRNLELIETELNYGN